MTIQRLATTALYLLLPATMARAESPYPGEGTATSPFLIATAAELVAVSLHPEDWDAVFLQTADIDLAGVDPASLGVIGTGEVPFTGTYDGGERSIANLDASGRGGLFGRVRGELRNVALINPTVTSPDVEWVGALCGYAIGRFAHLRNCHVIGGRIEGRVAGALVGAVTRATDCSAQDVEVIGLGPVGGLAGFANALERCWSTGTVTGHGSVGGLAGDANAIGFSFSRANVVSITGPAGGLAGSGDDNTPVFHHCYATGDVRTDGGPAGGIAGSIEEAGLDRCFATGNVFADSDPEEPDTSETGGLVGISAYDWYTGNPSNFWDTQTTGQSDAIRSPDDPESLDFFTPLTTAEAQTAAPYLAQGWDFVGEQANGTDDIWRMFPGDSDYPHLWWEPVPDPGFDREKLASNDPLAGYEFGHSVAVSGRTLAVGAPGPLGGAGAVHIFTRTMTGNGDGARHPRPRWEPVATLGGGNRFGEHVALDRKTLVVSSQGGVFVFEREGEDPTEWTLTAEFRGTAEVPVHRPRVAVHRDTILTLVPVEGDPTNEVRVFERRDGSWIPTDTIHSPEPEPEDMFGQLLALHRNTALVGSTQGIFIFRRDLLTRQWSLVTKLEERDNEERELAVALHGNIAVVAGDEFDAEGNHEAARVYHRFAGEPNGWGQVASLVIGDEAPEEARAYSVAVRGGTLVIGSGDDGTAGGAHVFKRRFFGPEPWIFDRILPWDDLVPGARFGMSVALSGNQIVVGAPASPLARPGYAYVFPVHQRRRFRDWLAHFFTAAEIDNPQIGGLSADPDADGLNNEIEFALGLDPASANEDEDYSPSVVPGIGGEPGEEGLAFTFSVPDAMPEGVIYEVQVAESPDDWQTLARRDPDGTWTGAAEVVEHVAEDGRICVTVHDTAAISDSSTRLMRLGVRGAE